MSQKRLPNTFFAIGTLAGDPIHARCSLCDVPTDTRCMELATYKGRTHDSWCAPYLVCPACAEKIRAAKEATR